MLVGQLTVPDSWSLLSSLTSSIHLSVSIFIIDENISPVVPLDQIRNELKSLLQVLVESIVNFFLNFVSLINGRLKLFLSDLSIRATRASSAFDLLASNSVSYSLLNILLSSFKFELQDLVLSLEDCDLVLIVIKLVRVLSDEGVVSILHLFECLLLLKNDSLEVLRQLLVLLFLLSQLSLQISNFSILLSVVRSSSEPEVT